MVSSKNIDNVKEAYSRFMSIKAPDLFDFGQSLQMVLIDLFTMDSALAGLSKRLVENMELFDLDEYDLQNEIINIDSLKNHTEFHVLDDNKKNELVEYASSIENLREAVCQTVNRMKRE